MKKLLSREGSSGSPSRPAKPSTYLQHRGPVWTESCAAAQQLYSNQKGATAEKRSRSLKVTPVSKGLALSSR